jgi:Putative beta-barrel porin 2
MRIKGLFFKLTLIASALSVAHNQQAWAQSSERPLSLSASQTISFDNNLFRLADNASVPQSSGLKGRGDQISNTSMALGYANSFGTQTVGVTGTLGVVRFADFSRGNRNVYGVNAKWTGDINRALFTGVDVGRSRSASAFGDQQGFNPNLISTTSLGLTLGYKLDPTWAIVSKFDQTNFDNSAPDLIAANRKVQGKEIALRYQPESGIDGAFVLRTVDIKSPNLQLTDIFGNPLTTNINNGYRQNLALFRVNYQPTGLSRLNGEIGYSQLDYVALARRNTSGLRVKGSYSYNYSDALSFGASIGRETSAAGTAFTGNVQNDSLGLSMSLSATPRIRLQANVDYIRRDFSADAGVALGQTGNRVDTTNALGLNVNYELLRNLNVSAGFARTSRSSSFSQFEYSGNVFTLGANLILR